MDINEILDHDSQFRYMLLSRMQSDCDYYLGNGSHHSKHLWALNEDKHIEYMVEIWNSFPEPDKPEWLSFDDINSYATEMGVDFEKILNHIQSEKAVKALQEFTNMSLISENSIDTGIILNLCNYYGMDTVVNLLSDNQRDMLRNAVEITLDYGDFKAMPDDLYSLYKKVVESEKSEATRKELSQNGILPDGWEWVNYEDASGHLKSPEGKPYFSYDWTTGEYKITKEQKHYDFFLDENINSSGYSVGSFSDFKKMAEEYIVSNVLSKEKSSVRDKLEKIKTSDDKNQTNNNQKRNRKDIVADFIAE